MILDGENAWEYYDGGGRPFLRALYRALGEAADIQTVTMSEAASGPAAPLASIFPGSWINGDFYIWIGHRDDHRAWDQLSDARGAFDERGAAGAADARDRALEELLIAEGSDWFWWYGDDHSSNHDADFDDLFRRHLRNAYDGARTRRFPKSSSPPTSAPARAPDRLEPSGRSDADPRRPGHQLSGMGGSAVSGALARPAGAMHEVAATWSASRIERAASESVGIPVCACDSRELGAVISSSSRSARRPFRSAWWFPASRGAWSDEHRRGGGAELDDLGQIVRFRSRESATPPACRFPVRDPDSRSLGRAARNRSARPVLDDRRPANSGSVPPTGKPRAFAREPWRQGL